MPPVGRPQRAKLSTHRAVSQMTLPGALIHCSTPNKKQKYYPRLGFLCGKGVRSTLSSHLNDFLVFLQNISLILFDPAFSVDSRYCRQCRRPFLSGVSLECWRLSCIYVKAPPVASWMTGLLLSMGKAIPRGPSTASVKSAIRCVDKIKFM